MTVFKLNIQFSKRLKWGRLNFISFSNEILSGKSAKLGVAVKRSAGFVVQVAASALPFFPVAKFDVVAIATSAGGLRALLLILQYFPAQFPAAITVVQHLNPQSQSLLPLLLSRQTKLLVKQAEANERLQSGTVFIAPPDWHLLISPDGTLELAKTKKVNFTRPAADPMFESLATSCQDRAIAVVLTGTGRDGAAGLRRVKQMGGMTLVQDPNTAEFAGMPKAALETQAVDRVLSLPQIAATVIQSVQGNNTRK